MDQQIVPRKHKMFAPFFKGVFTFILWAGLGIALAVVLRFWG